ncbi:MAG TPA: hypothetical protein VD902_20080 [Symbiobacteriaceae bacterium]|nr:hypothetical protein [Symbiobacteriaceae bacterium]
MAAAQDAQDSLRERARRVLMDNHPEQEPAAHAPARPEAEPSGTGEQIALRLQAIRLVRELEPKRACYADRVRDLSRTLMQLSGDSVHYRTVLQKLQEAHEEWQDLEEKMWAANYILRSTEWLVQLLADPTEQGKEAGRREN